MKHAVFPFLIVLICYALWQVTPKPERNKAAEFRRFARGTYNPNTRQGANT